MDLRLTLMLCALALGCEGATTDESGTGTDELAWYATCGDPACNVYRGPFDGVITCDTEAAGESCSDDGAECDLQNDCNQLLRCTTDDPQDQEGGCPISRRDAKRDIVYIDTDAREQLRRQALAMRLATWQYRHEAPEARPHLGFVIDDQPTSPAVRDGGERVDLYGYTSLAIAALQAQDAELAALRAELTALRERIDACE